MYQKQRNVSIPKIEKKDGKYSAPRVHILGKYGSVGGRGGD